MTNTPHATKYGAHATKCWACATEHWACAKKTRVVAHATKILACLWHVYGPYFCGMCHNFLWLGPHTFVARATTFCGMCYVLSWHMPLFFETYAPYFCGMLITTPVVFFRRYGSWKILFASSVH